MVDIKKKIQIKNNGVMVWNKTKLTPKGFGCSFEEISKKRGVCRK